MVHPDLNKDVFLQALAIGLNGKIYTVGDSSGDGGWCYEEDYHNYQLMQYTGLKDKNGKEIYGGDIVEYRACEGCDDCGVVVSEVIWRDGGWYIVTEWQGEQKDIPSSLCSLYGNDLVIIGNIYENPELLKNI